VADVRPGRPALLLLCAAAFMAVADTTIVSIALPSIKRELGFSGAGAQWILNGYALAFGGLLLFCGRRPLRQAPALSRGARRVRRRLPHRGARDRPRREVHRDGGLTLLGAGLLLITRMSESDGLITVLCGTVVGEFGFMLSNVPLTIAASGSMRERGLASRLMNTSIQLGNTLGLAAVATVVGAVGGSPVGGPRSGLLLCVAIVVLALPTTVFGLRGEAGKVPVPDHGSKARSDRAPRR
jgi:MFS family permease